MDIEDLLREKLRAGSEQPLPSPGFEGRVRRSLTTQVRSRRRAHILEGLVAIAAVMALVAVAVPWILGPRSGFAGPGASATEDRTVEPTVALTPTPAPTPTEVPLAHAQKWFLSFDYPADWILTDREVPSATVGLNSQAQTQGDPVVFGFVGNGSASEDCVPNPGAAPYSCSTTWDLQDDTIAMRFGIAGPRLGWTKSTPTYLWTSAQANAETVLPGAQSLTVDNLPARFVRSTTNAVPYSEETVPGATDVLWWGLPSQSSPGFGWTIVAAVRGPNAAELEVKAQALVASIHFVPEPQVLPTDPTALDQARRLALARFYADDRRSANDEHVHEIDCFPTEVGESRQAEITQTLATNPLTQPLSVTCTVESMVPSAMQGWILTLSQSWEAGAGYPAGKATYRAVLFADGQAQGWAVVGLPDTLNYPHQGGSKYPG